MNIISICLRFIFLLNGRLQRADDIGWFPIYDPEGSIKSFTINGNRDFSEDDSFNYDDKIIIVIHTKLGSGCEK